MTLARGYEVELIGFKSEDIPLYAHWDQGTGKPLGSVLYHYRVENRHHQMPHERRYLGEKAAKGIYPFAPGPDCLSRTFGDGGTGCPRCRARAAQNPTGPKAAAPEEATGVRIASTSTTPSSIGENLPESPVAPTGAPPEVTPPINHAHPAKGSPSRLRKKSRKKR